MKGYWALWVYDQRGGDRMESSRSSTLYHPVSAHWVCFIDARHISNLRFASVRYMSYVRKPYTPDPYLLNPKP